MTRRPSAVHDRLQPVQPSSSPNRPETRPVLPIVPPHTQSSPGATRARRDPRALREECLRYRQTDPLARPGDDGDFVREL